MGPLGQHVCPAGSQAFCSGSQCLLYSRMFAGVILFLLTFVLPETYAPLLLKRRAAKLRAEHNTENIRTEQEVFKRSVSELLKESLVRPFILIVTEPILVLFAFYAALIYGLLYSFFFAFPVIYEPYGYSEGIESLMFIVRAQFDHP